MQSISIRGGCLFGGWQSVFAVRLVGTGSVGKPGRQCSVHPASNRLARPLFSGYPSPKMAGRARLQHGDRAKTHQTSHYHLYPAANQCRPMLKVVYWMLQIQQQHSCKTSWWGCEWESSETLEWKFQRHKPRLIKLPIDITCQLCKCIQKYK